MDIARRTVIGAGLGIGLLAAASARAQWGDPPTPATGDPTAPAWPPKESYTLWPGRPPGAPATPPSPNWTMNGPANGRELWIRGVPEPELHVFRAAKPDGSALLSLPGGGYGFLSVQNEGIDVAHYFNRHRTTVFVLTYRLPGEGWADRHLVALQDAQRAMRMIRARADFFDVDAKRVGIVGFSAGGHLAADLAVSYDEHIYDPVDAADEQSAKPAFTGLVYAVTSLKGRAGGMPLLGDNPSAALVEARSPVLHVTDATPPSFLAHSFDDPLVTMDHSLDWIAACEKAKVPVEAHLFGEGGHGYGLHLPEDMPGSRWPELFALWLRKHGG